VVVISTNGCATETDKIPASHDYRIIFQSARDAPQNNHIFHTNPQRYFELYFMNNDGSYIQRVTNNISWENQADVSPDGKKIVCSLHDYSRDGIQETDPGWDIAVMDTDGSNLERLTNND